MNVGFLVFVGLPGSGKTTLAKRLKHDWKQCRDDNYFFIHICYDELLPFSAVTPTTEWKLLRNSLANDIEKLLKAIKLRKKESCPPIFSDHLIQLTSYDTNIVLMIDDNMYFKSMRYSIYQIAKRNDAGFCQVYLNCHLNVALSKNSERDRDSIVPLEVIKTMSDKIEAPSEYNHWERNSVNINAFCDFNDFCQQLFPILHTSLHDKSYFVADNSEERELSILICKKNVFHQVDLALRKIVGMKMNEFVSDNKSSNFKTITSQLNSRKTEILNDIKTGNICLTPEVLNEINDGLKEKYELHKLLNCYF